MKKNIGKSLALYPTPLVVVGTMVNGKPNYVLVGHVGIIGHDRIMVMHEGQKSPIFFSFSSSLLFNHNATHQWGSSVPLFLPAYNQRTHQFPRKY